MLIAVWTPEYRADTPAWCVEPQVVGIGSQRTLWCKHALSTADWWNVYTNGMGDGSEGFQDTPAAPGQTALFRFNSDSDLDGYSDRSEERLGTDPNDPASYPRPELLAGVNSIRSGRLVTATLSLLNTGVYDAYGVEAVMIAPNDTISITNNTVGGSGRVRAQKQVIVGSRIAPQTPLPAAWLTAGHAQPAAGGYYTGTTGSHLHLHRGVRQRRRLRRGHGRLDVGLERRQGRQRQPALRQHLQIAVPARRRRVRAAARLPLRQGQQRRELHRGGQHPARHLPVHHRGGP